ncbi:hypothetical protein CXG81DRAFT_9046 [Caulochytrium protostelioides]|uniref:RmlD-like substrate binding domain-containing protein n=1 Tax=Caulochytrium protostelioides TaxID=1555241 RepID=A0A4P9XF58_9FUNG|nr:hypothetical protein CXG81DRAFT_9046 [Caulochytrium protostelioides]|eukprot:RKP03831.1 hypothetical protein CXG81DRAFT_9046 [Caulochytrium protostelioides]
MPYLVLATGWSRADGDVVAKLDLTQPSEVDACLDRFKPDVVIHAAAEKRPDVAERDPERVQAVNVDATAHLAQHCARDGIFLIFISTDYVFDGQHPPYEVDATTHPLNAYGRSKLAGEHAVIAAQPASTAETAAMPRGRYAVLRVPVLYGPASPRAESAVNVLLDSLLAARDQVVGALAIAQRFPTHVADVADVCRQLAARALQLSSVAATAAAPTGVYHFSGTRQMTKWTMASTLTALLEAQGALKPATAADLLERGLKRVTTPTAGATAQRPDNAQLSNRRLQDEGYTLPQTDFTAWWRDALAADPALA